MNVIQLQDAEKEKKYIVLILNATTKILLLVVSQAVYRLQDSNNFQLRR